MNWSMFCRIAALGLFGLVYVAYPLLLVPMIWNRDDGKPLILFLMVCVWSGDIAALYVGRSFGKHKLHSPQPQQDLGGRHRIGRRQRRGGAGRGSAGRFPLRPRSNTVLHVVVEPLWQSAVLAIVLNVAAQLGDLVESAIKRGAGVKDSRHHACRATAGSSTASTRCCWPLQCCGECCC